MSVIKKCWFDADGQLINIGEWDYRPEQVEVKPPVIDEETGEIIEPGEYETVITNPLPEGAYSEECEVYQDEDGAWRLAGYTPPKTPEQQRIEALESAIAELTMLLASNNGG